MKPVAWMIRRDENITKGIGHEIQLTLMDATRPEFWIKGKIAKGYEVFPLYTHPAKTLTDEEIANIRDEFLSPKNGDIFNFARAILRKAQEK
jgi:hypothetical protein